MFDSREIAEKALMRIEQINEQKRRRKRSAAVIGATLCISVTGLLLFNTPTDHDNGTTGNETRTVYIEEPAIPLARPPTPTETTATCAKCGKEIEEQKDKEEETKETKELCEQCKPTPTPVS